MFLRGDKMRILYVLDYFYPYVGGVPTLFTNLAQQMVRRGHEVTVVTSWVSGTKKNERWKGINIVRAGKNREGFLYHSTIEMLKMKENFDIVHTSTYSSMIPSFVYSFFKRKRTILSVHEVWSLKEWIEFTRLKGFFYFLEERSLFMLPFDKYISPSFHTKNDLLKLGIENPKIVVIPHGIDHEIFNPSAKKYRGQTRKRLKIKEEDIVCSFIGKPTEFKGIRYMLDAMEKVLERTDVKFIFVLSKSYSSEYKQFLKRVNSSKTIKKSTIILEPKSDADYTAKIISCSDFIVMPSLTEGFGFVAAESASIGIPAIVTKNTSLVEVVDDKKNGIHVNLRDSDHLADEIIRLAKDKRLLKSLSRPKRFDKWEDVAAKYEKIYKDQL